MPYAAKATVEHDYVSTSLKVWLTFRHPMRRTDEPLATPPVYDIYPPLSLWLLEADSVAVDIISAEWVDEFTLLLTSDTIATRPSEVYLAYDGPHPDLSTTWGKDWEPWGPILSIDQTATIWSTGMIILWSGSVVSIPSGWQLCDGTNGTPDLRDKFVVCAGSTYNPAATAGNLTHNHTFTGAAHNHAVSFVSGGGSVATGAMYIQAATAAGTINQVNHLPPYYALCYIMKL